MLARLLNNAIKIVRMFTLAIFLIIILGAILYFLLAHPPQNGKAQKPEPYHPVGTAFHIDSTRLEELREQTSADSSKAVKVWRKAIVKVEKQAKELDATKDTLTAISVAQNLHLLLGGN